MRKERIKQLVDVMQAFSEGKTNLWNLHRFNSLQI